MNWEYVFGDKECKKLKFLSEYKELFRVMKNENWYVPPNLDGALFIDYAVFNYRLHQHTMIFKCPVCVVCKNNLKYDMAGKAYGCIASPNKLFVCFSCAPTYRLVLLAMDRERRRKKFIEANKKVLSAVFAEEIKLGEVKL